MKNRWISTMRAVPHLRGAECPCADCKFARFIQWLDLEVDPRYLW